MQFNIHAKTPPLAAVLIGCGFFGIIGLVSLLVSTLPAGTEGPPSVERSITDQAWWVIMVVLIAPIFLMDFFPVASDLMKDTRKALKIPLYKIHILVTGGLLGINALYIKLGALQLTDNKLYFAAIPFGLWLGYCFLLGNVVIIRAYFQPKEEKTLSEQN